MSEWYGARFLVDVFLSHHFEFYFWRLYIYIWFWIFENRIGVEELTISCIWTNMSGFNWRLKKPQTKLFFFSKTLFFICVRNAFVGVFLAVLSTSIIIPHDEIWFHLYAWCSSFGDWIYLVYFDIYHIQTNNMEWIWLNSLTAAVIVMLECTTFYIQCEYGLKQIHSIYSQIYLIFSNSISVERFILFRFFHLLFFLLSV